MGANFNLIVIDPPWSFQDELTMNDVARGATSHYNTLSNLDIQKLDIKKLSDPNGAVLALWVPSSLLEDGIKCFNEYGFKIKQTYIWVKTKNEPLKPLYSLMVKELKKIKDNPKLLSFSFLKKIIKNSIMTFKVDHNLLRFGMGRLFRQSHEICLIGINNKNIYQNLMNKSQRSVSLAINEIHSKKPDDLQNSLEQMFPDAKKIEIFARRKKDGWICIGNEAPDTFGEDIRDSISNLLLEEK